MPKMNSRENLAVVLIVLSGILYGSMGLFGTWILDQGYTVSNMMFWRFAIASLTLLPFGFKHLSTLRQKLSRAELLRALIAALLYSFGSALYFVASAAIGTGISMVVFYSYPIFIFLWLRFFLKQQIAGASWAALVLVSVGLVLLNQNPDPTHLNHWGFVWAILSSAAYASYILFSKKQASTLDPWVSTFILCLVSSTYFLAVTTQIEQKFLWPHSTGTWLTLFGLGFFATAVPVLLMLQGLKTVSADMASILSVLEPVVTVCVGALLLNEEMNSLQVLGVCIVLSGAIGSTWSLKKAKSRLLVQVEPSVEPPKGLQKKIALDNYPSRSSGGIL